MDKADRTVLHYHTVPEPAGDVAAFTGRQAARHSVLAAQAARMSGHLRAPRVPARAARRPDEPPFRGMDDWLGRAVRA